MNQHYKFILKSIKNNKLITIYLILRIFIFRKFNFLDKKYYKKYQKINKQIYNFKSPGNYSQDWFSYNKKYLLKFIYKFNLIEKKLIFWK